MPHPRSPRFPVAALVALTLLGTGAARAQEFPLELVVADVEAFADTEVDILISTLEDRPLASAAFAIEARERDDDLPIPAFASVVSAAGFSGADDAMVSWTFDAAAQRVEVLVESASGTLNDAYGPLAVVRFQLAPGLAEDLRFDLRMDPDVVLVAQDLTPVVSAAGRGRLRITVPEPGAGLSGFGGETFPGATVVFGVSTSLPFPIGGGTVEFLYDPSLTDGTPPVVRADPRFGAVVVDAVTEPVPGQLIVVFSSPDGTLNTGFPGMFLSAAVPSLDTIVPPTTFPFALGPATQLLDPLGQPIEPLEAEADPTEFLVPELLLLEGLEGGNLLGWWDFVI